MWNTESSRKAVLEIMLGGAMLFNFDFRGADIVAVVLSFMVLYFAVVASLTDK